MYAVSAKYISIAIVGIWKLSTALFEGKGQSIQFEDYFDQFSAHRDGELDLSIAGLYPITSRSSIHSIF